MRKIYILLLLFVSSFFVSSCLHTKKVTKLAKNKSFIYPLAKLNPLPTSKAKPNIAKPNTLQKNTSNTLKLSTPRVNTKEKTFYKYRLKTGDKFEISLLGEPEMTQTVLIIPDGTISYYLTGEILASGKTISDLRKDIVKKLDKFYINPQVSIIPKMLHNNINAKKFATIIGAVNNSGKFEIQKNDKLIDIIAKSGGLKYASVNGSSKTIANLSISYLSRNNVKLNINFDSLLNQGDMTQNILLENEDIIYIADSQSAFVTIIGAVNASGQYELKGGDKVLDILAKADGLKYMVTDLGAQTIANLKASYISRNNKNLHVDFDKLLRSGDMSQNILLKKDDFIYIADSDNNSIYVLGEVIIPKTIPFTRDITLLEAISIAGGFTDYAEYKHITILRRNKGKREIVNVDLSKLLKGEQDISNDLFLKGGDLVFVQEVGLSTYSRFAGYLSSILDLIMQGYGTREAVRFPMLHRPQGR